MTNYNNNRTNLWRLDDSSRAFAAGFTVTLIISMVGIVLLAALLFGLFGGLEYAIAILVWFFGSIALIVGLPVGLVLLIFEVLGAKGKREQAEKDRRWKEESEARKRAQREAGERLEKRRAERAERERLEAEQRERDRIEAEKSMTPHERWWAETKRNMSPRMRWKLESNERSRESDRRIYGNEDHRPKVSGPGSSSPNRRRLCTCSENG